MDYRYQHHRGYDGIGDPNEQGDCDDDSTGNHDAGNYWQEYRGSVDDAFGDVYEDEPQNPSRVTFFEGASNFVIDGGSFINNNGGSYADFEWESEPQIPSRSPPSKSSFFEGSRDFVISDAHTPKEYSSTYRKPRRPHKKRQEQSDKSLGPSRTHGHPTSPIPSKVRKSSSKPAPTFPEPHSEFASNPVFVMRDTYHPQDDSGIVLPTPDYQTVTTDMPTPMSMPRAPQLQRDYRSKSPKVENRMNITSDAQMHSTTAKLKKLSLNGSSRSSRTRTQNGDHDTDYFSPFSMPQPQEVDPSANWRSPTGYSTLRAFDASDTDPVLEPQPQRFSMPQPVSFPDSPKS